MRWVGDVAMLCPSNLREIAAATAAGLSGNVADNTPLFFSRPVRAIGGSEVIYYMAHSRVRENVYSKFPKLKQAFPGAEYCLTRKEGDESTRVNVYEWLASLGLEFADEEE